MSGTLSEEVQELIYVRDTLYTSLQAQADVAHSGTSDPNLIESTMEQTSVEEVTNMEKDASKLWFTSLTAGAVVGLDKIIMLIALIVYRIGWWATIYCQQILLGMLTIFVGIQSSAQMGRCLGKVAHTLSDCTLLRSYAVLRWILCTAPI